MTFGEAVHAYFLPLFPSIPLDKCEAMFRTTKAGELVVTDLKKANHHDGAEFRKWAFGHLDIALPAPTAQQVLDKIHSLAKNWSEAQGGEDDEAIDKVALVEGLRQFMVAVSFGPKLKLAIWSLDVARELRVVDKPEEAISSMTPARAREFGNWFASQFKAKNLPRMDVFFKQGFSFDAPPSPASWLGQDKMENDLTGLLHEAGHCISAEEIAGVAWEAKQHCFYNPVAREDIPVEWVDGQIKLAKRADGSAYDLEIMPEAWESWESRIDSRLRACWRTQIFSIFAPIGLRGRMAIWGRSPGGKGQSTVQNVIFRRIKGQHCAAADPDSFGKGWKFDSADLWNKSLLLIPDVKAEGSGFMRGSTFHKFTGADPLKIEPKFGRTFTGRCWGKPWITSNEFPNIEIGAAHAMDRLALFEFGEMPPEILDKETARGPYGQVLLSDRGIPRMRTDFEERLGAQFDHYLAHCFKAWYAETHGMKAPPSTHPAFMYHRIISACGSSSQVAVEYRFDEYFESGDDLKIPYSELSQILRGWNKNDPAMKYEVTGFVKWAESLNISRGKNPVYSDYRDGVAHIIGIKFKGAVIGSRGKMAVQFPDGSVMEGL